MRFIGGISLFLLGFALAGCREERVPTPEPAGASTRFPIGISGQKLHARVAVTELEIATGLMHTTKLPDDEGMLFIYRDADRRAFWMLNVPYDIDLGYFTEDGILDEIVAMRANDTTPVPSRSDRIRYVMEAPTGWYSKHATGKGAALDTESIRKALSSRGFTANEFLPQKAR